MNNKKTAPIFSLVPRDLRRASAMGGPEAASAGLGGRAERR